MNIRIAIASVAIAFASLSAFPASATEDQATIRALASYANMSEDEVRMVLRGHTYRDRLFPGRFKRAERKLTAAIGWDNYRNLRNLASGRTVVLNLKPQDPASALACVASND